VHDIARPTRYPRCGTDFLIWLPLTAALRRCGFPKA
jgi:hypothetical protein